MSTPAPAPFNPHDFPPDLLAAQRKLAKLYAALHAHQATLPWSREAHPGWPDENERGRQRPERPETIGWDDGPAAEYDRLWEDLRQAAAAVQCHPHWETCRKEGIDGAALVDARQALKHAKGAVPLRKDDVDAAA
ncbi:hypothetical protein [Streptomyces sp. NBC_01794]|uniref:hypothetical protein n=1 Tax=Streptomyces sp. NBC_01794 TaxID=2975942 RepID=UPI0030921CEF|nr:hypothetical protein OIE54_09485 [Streptomyces sp. NBC_01794]